MIGNKNCKFCHGSGIRHVSRGVRTCHEGEHNDTVGTETRQRFALIDTAG